MSVAAGQLEARGLAGHLPVTFDFSLACGACTAITGPSGVGKSSLLRMVCDLDPSGGDVLLGGVSRHAVKGAEWRRLVGYVPAEASWWDEVVRDHFEPDALPSPALLDAAGLAASLLDAPVSRLSSGERQRMALLRAVARQPRFLLLDEPTSSLDHATVLKIEALLASLAQGGMGLLVVSHDEAQVRRIAQRHLRLDRDGLHECGPAEAAA